MATIRCYDEDGRSVPVAPEAITFRPAVYGIFIENDTVLLWRHPRTQRWQPPGGILDDLQTPDQAVRYHFRNLTGITPLLGPLLYTEDRYVLDRDRRAWHLSHLYYALDRPPLTSTTPAELSGEQEISAVPLAELRRQDMQFGYDAVQAAVIRLGPEREAYTDPQLHNGQDAAVDSLPRRV